MCSNYRPVTSADRLAQYFGVVHAHDAPPVDTYPSGLGPCILLARSGDNGAHHGLALVGAQQQEINLEAVYRRIVGEVAP